MPDKLTLFLQTLANEDAEAILDWLDSTPDAIYLMMDLIHKSKKL